MKRITVVIPCFNGGAYLAEAIDSALGQSYPEREVVLVDDGSTDDSPAIMTRYADRIRVVRQANSGLSAARNAGLAVASGEYVAFLDCDDWWDPEFLAQSIAHLESSGAALSYSGWQNIGAPAPYNLPFVPEDYELSQPSKAIRLIRCTGWPVHAAVVRKELIDDVGGFNPSLPSCEDFDLWLKIALSHAIVLVPRVLAYYRFHPGQMTRRTAENALTHYAVQKHFLAAHPHYLGDDRRTRRSITTGELLNRAYRAYWARDLEGARPLFRRVMFDGYGTLKDWKYMLPSLLPQAWHSRLIRWLESKPQL